MASTPLTPLESHTSHLETKFNILECVMHRKLLIKELGLKLTYIKVEPNIVVDFLIQMDLNLK